MARDRIAIDLMTRLLRSPSPPSVEPVVTQRKFVQPPARRQTANYSRSDDRCDARCIFSKAGEDHPTAIDVCRVPRVSRLMALAIRCDQLIHDDRRCTLAGLAVARVKRMRAVLLFSGRAMPRQPIGLLQSCSKAPVKHCGMPVQVNRGTKCCAGVCYTARGPPDHRIRSQELPGEDSNDAGFCREN